MSPDYVFQILWAWVYHVLKTLQLVKAGAFVLATASKFALFSVSRLKDEKLTKKQTYMKTEAYKLYSRVLGEHWTFQPNVIKIDPYNFELYRFKVGPVFETQCMYTFTSELAHSSVTHTYTLCLRKKTCHYIFDANLNINYWIIIFLLHLLHRL